MEEDLADLVRQIYGESVKTSTMFDQSNNGNGSCKWPLLNEVYKNTFITNGELKRLAAMLPFEFHDGEIHMRLHKSTEPTKNWTGIDLTFATSLRDLNHRRSSQQWSQSFAPGEVMIFWINGKTYAVSTAPFTLGRNYFCVINVTDASMYAVEVFGFDHTMCLYFLQNIYFDDWTDVITTVNMKAVIESGITRITSEMYGTYFDLKSKGEAMSEWALAWVLKAVHKEQMERAIRLAFSTLGVDRYFVDMMFRYLCTPMP